jgi:hypothetical protein
MAATLDTYDSLLQLRPSDNGTIGEINWETMWDDLMTGKIRNICLCEATATRLKLKW